MSVLQVFSETEGNSLAPTSLLKLIGRASEAHRFNSSVLGELRFSFSKYTCVND